MPADRGIHVGHGEFSELRLDVRRVLGNSVVSAVQSIAQPRTLRLRQNVCEFREELASGFECLLRYTVSHHFVVFIQCRTQSKNAILRFDRTNPYLEDLLLARNIRIRCHQEHATRKIFDVRVITIVEPTCFAQPLIKIAVR